MHFKGFFFFDMKPIALRKDKIVYNLALAFLSAVGLKEK